MLSNRLKKFKFFNNFSKLRYGLVSNTGRNFLGRTTVYTKAPGIQTMLYRVVSYQYKYISNGFVIDLITDKRRNGFLGLVFFFNGLLTHLLLSEGKLLNSQIPGYCTNKLTLLTQMSAAGWSFLHLFPVGSLIYNVELYPFRGGVLSRAAGTSSLIASKSTRFVILKLKSGWKLLLSPVCMASLGIVSNSGWKYKNFKKAGFNINRGRKQKVRGVAKNPVDHPHGGGNGKTSKKPVPRTPWGKFSVLSKTRTKLFLLKKRKKFKA